MDTLRKTLSVKLNSSESLLSFNQLEIKPFGFDQLRDVKNEPAVIQQRFVDVKDVPWSSSVKQENPESVQIKEEEDELWIGHGGERVYSHGQEEDDVRRFDVSDKNEEDDEKLQSSQLLQIKVEDKSTNTDIRQQFVIKEVPWSSSVKQESPESVQIKEEEKELWTSQEREKFNFHKQEDAAVGRFTDSVKSEEDEEKPQFSELLHIKTEDNKETEAPTCSPDTQMIREPDCKGPEPGRNPSPDCNSPPHLGKNAFESSGDNNEDNRNKVSSSLESKNIVGDVDSSLESAKVSFRCSVCKRICRKTGL